MNRSLSSFTFGSFVFRCPRCHPPSYPIPHYRQAAAPVRDRLACRLTKMSDWASKSLSGPAGQRDVVNEDVDAQLVVLAVSPERGGLIDFSSVTTEAFVLRPGCGCFSCEGAAGPGPGTVPAHGCMIGSSCFSAVFWADPDPLTEEHARDPINHSANGLLSLRDEFEPSAHQHRQHAARHLCQPAALPVSRVSDPEKR